MNTESAKQIGDDGVKLGNVVSSEKFVFIDPLREVGQCPCDIPPDSYSLTMGERRAKHTCERYQRSLDADFK